MNGQTGIIAAVEGQKVTVDTKGKKLVIDAGEYKHFDHGVSAGFKLTESPVEK